MNSAQPLMFIICKDEFTKHKGTTFKGETEITVVISFCSIKKCPSVSHSLITINKHLQCFSDEMLCTILR